MLVLVVLVIDFDEVGWVVGGGEERVEKRVGETDF